MTNVVRASLVEKRKELNDRAIQLRDQWQGVKDDLASRRQELNGVEAQLADLDAWLLANPNPTAALPV